jgi:hypothetical protein
VVALSIPIVAIVSGTLLKLARMFTDQRRPLPTDGLHERVEAMEQDLVALRQELTDTQERLDFTERLLANVKDQPRLGNQ